ncbi:MAG: metallophosphoesterase [Candidatus Neomarinimicrobiota bacterium]
MLTLVTNVAPGRTPGKVLSVYLSILVLAACPSLIRSEKSVRFAVIGDYGSASRSEQDVAELVKSWRPDFIITTGDNNYPSGDAFTIDANIGQYYHAYIFPYLGGYGEGADTNRFFPSLGTHDYYCYECPQPYLDYFELPGNERYYDFTWGPAHFFAVNSNEFEPDGTDSTSVQALWLKEQLSSSIKNFRFVYVHHAPYSSGPHGSTFRMRWPYRKWGVDAVFSGHDHVYERIKQDNVLYLVNGLGGDSRYAFPDSIEGSEFRYSHDFGAMLVEVSPKSAVFRFINRNGEVIDAHEYGKYAERYDNGQLKAQWRMKDGDFDGIQTQWYRSGRKKGEWNYTGGELDGKQIQWYENRRLKLEHYYHDGVPVGKWTEWHENGFVKGEWYFEGGKEITRR